MKIKIRTSEALCDALMDVVDRAMDGGIEPLEAVAVVGLLAGVMIKEAPNSEIKLEATKQTLRAMGRHAGINFSVDALGARDIAELH